MSLTLIREEFNISDRKARSLIKKFIGNEIIALKVKGTSSSKKSVYVYLSVLECVDEKHIVNDIVNDTVKAQLGHSEMLKNEHIESIERHSGDIVSGIVVNNSKKELIKKNYKKDIYSEIVERFNSTCSGLSKVMKITDKRKKSIDSRIKEYDKATIYKVLDMVSDSRFLNGDNKANWKANFDWILNPNNFVKVLEGNYENKEQQITEQTKVIYDKDGYAIF